MKTTSASQSGSITTRLSTAALIVLAGTVLGVFAAAGPFQSRLPSYSATGASPPSAFASNAIQRFSDRSCLVEGFNGSPKRVHGPFPTIQLQQVATGFTSPVTVTNAGDGTGRLFIVQQTGEIRILIDGTVLPTPFLDISDLVGCGCGEQGLLGLAFHPEYADNGFFYVDYTDDDGNTQVARYTVSAGDPNVADPGSRHPILNQDQPFTNHNGGQLAFGPDGYLYIAFGDGGSSGDPQENGQDLTTWLGKILRVDIDGDDFPDPNLNYAVPPDNPFAGNPDALDEIWAYGVRNPWRCTFDRVTGDFFIADVGQNAWEEIDFQLAASPGGENYGWDVLEGMHCFEDVPLGSCNDFLNGGSTLPVLEYSHAFGCSVTGGYRYRGQLYPQLDGIYFYSDLCSGTIWGAIQDIQGRWVSQDLLASGLTVTTFGEDEAGEIYVADYSGGTLYQIVGTEPTPTPTPTVTPTPTATATATVTPTPTATPSGSPTTTPRPTPTARPAVTPRPRPTPVPRPTASRLAESLRIVDQNGKPAVSGVPSATSTIVDVTVGQGFAFVPSTVNIGTGDTVRWTWASGGHSVTSGTPCAADGQFCSPDNMNCQAGTLSDAGAVYEHTFTQSGTYSYFCFAHCEYGMSGTIIVYPPPQPTPRNRTARLRPTPAPRPTP